MTRSNIIPLSISICLALTCIEQIHAQIDSNKLRLEKLILENDYFINYLDTIVGVDKYNYEFRDTSNTPSYKRNRNDFPILRFSHYIPSEPSDYYPIYNSIKGKEGVFITPTFLLSYDHTFIVDQFWVNFSDSTVWTLNKINGKNEAIGQVPESLKEIITVLK